MPALPGCCGILTVSISSLLASEQLHQLCLQILRKIMWKFWNLELFLTLYRNHDFFVFSPAPELIAACSPCAYLQLWSQSAGLFLVLPQGVRQGWHPLVFLLRFDCSGSARNSEVLEVPQVMQGRPGGSYLHSVKLWNVKWVRSLSTGLGCTDFVNGSITVITGVLVYKWNFFFFFLIKSLFLISEFNLSLGIICSWCSLV